MVYLGLGTNLGERTSNLSRAIDLLIKRDVTVLRKSGLYETEPQDVTDQPWFLNMVVECESRQPAEELIQALLAIEAEIGRHRGDNALPRGPRLIDIDLLLYGNLVIRMARVIVPHPRMLERRFVLEPLLELAPKITDPRTGEKFARALPSVRCQKVTKVS